jgi:hypothetical protein
MGPWSSRAVRAYSEQVGWNLQRGFTRGETRCLYPWIGSFMIQVSDPASEGGERVSEFGVGCMFGTRSGDDKEVPPGREFFPVGTIDFPETPPDQIPVDRPPEPPADGETGAARRGAGGYEVSDDKEVVFDALALPDHPEHGGSALDAFPSG